MTTWDRCGQLLWASDDHERLVVREELERIAQMFRVSTRWTATDRDVLALSVDLAEFQAPY